MAAEIESLTEVVKTEDSRKKIGEIIIFGRRIPILEVNLKDQMLPRSFGPGSREEEEEEEKEEKGGDAMLTWMRGPDNTPGDGVLIQYYREKIGPALDLFMEEKIKPLLGL